MPKPIFRCSLAVVSVLLLSISLSADIISSNQVNPDQSFTVMGSTISFETYSGLTTMMCPNMGDGGETQIACYDGFAEALADGPGIFGDGWAYSLSPGDKVATTSDYTSQALLIYLEDDAYEPYYTEGNWFVNTPAPDNYPPDYMGFRVPASDGSFHYGWAAVDVTGSTPSIVDPYGKFTVKVWDYAYESCPDTGITVGATSGGATCADPPDPPDPPDPTPEPSTGIMLAIGLSGLEVFLFGGRKNSRSTVNSG